MKHFSAFCSRAHLQSFDTGKQNKQTGSCVNVHLHSSFKTPLDRVVCLYYMCRHNHHRPALLTAVFLAKLHFPIQRMNKQGGQGHRVDPQRIQNKIPSSQNIRLHPNCSQAPF